MDSKSHGKSHGRSHNDMMQPPTHRTRLEWLPHLVAAVVIFAGAWYVAQARNRSFLANSRAEFAAIAHDIASGITQQITQAKILSDGLAAAVAIKPELSDTEYERLASRLIRGRPEVRNVAAMPDMVVEHVYPLAGNEAVLGFDLRTRPDQMRDVRRAVQLGIATWGGPYDLVQGGRGFIVRSPVHIPISPTSTGRRLWGVMALVLDHAEFMYLALSGRVPDGADYLITDQRGQIIAGAESVRMREPVTVSLTNDDMNWSVSVAPSGGWPARAPQTALIWFAAAALLTATTAAIRALQRESAQRLAAQRLLSEAVDALDDGFVLYSADDRLLMCNSRYREIYAASAEAMRPGATFEEILRFGLERGQYPEAEGREEEWLAERLRAHRTLSEPVRQQLPDGRWLRIVERRTPSGNTVGFRVDVTELQVALERAEEANRVKTDFLKTVSRELRKPLGVMLGYNDFLKHPRKLPSHGALQTAVESGRASAVVPALASFETEIARFARLVDRSGQHLLSLIMSILDYASLVEGKIILDPRPMPLAPLLQEIAETFADTAARKGLRMEVEAGDLAARADARRLRQVLINLVSNAIKFTDEGKITLRAAQIGGQVRIDVADTGCGIPAEDHERIFERFTRIDGSAQGERGGIGLGLSICRDLVALHGGKISVSSEPGKGSVFSVTLQAAMAHQPARLAS